MGPQPKERKPNDISLFESLGIFFRSLVLFHTHAIQRNVDNVKL